MSEDWRSYVGYINVYPDRNDPDKVSNANIFPYSRRVSPFGINGGYYYTSLKYEFGS